MTITLIIIGYILNVFLNRWLNYILYTKYCQRREIVIWFLAIAGTTIFIIAIITNYFEYENWFTGKYWNKK